MFREEVKEWRDKNIIMICGQPCTKLKEENGNTYYHLCKPLFTSEFGADNNYANSMVRKELLEHEFTLSLQKEYGDCLVPAVMDLTALDGLKDYGKITDIVGIPDLNLYRECRENMLVGDRWWWLSTPNSTPSGTGSSNVRCVRDCGDVGWYVCYWYGDVRPFWDGRCDKVGETPKFEPHHQKNRQPFLARKSQDKYKGMQNIKYHFRL